MECTKIFAYVKKLYGRCRECNDHSLTVCDFLFVKVSKSKKTMFVVERGAIVKRAMVYHAT